MVACSFLAKVFWKGEFEGKNLFFKKGFPLLIKLEKTSLKGSQLAGDLSFFKLGEARRRDFNHKEHKEHKERKDNQSAKIRLIR